MAEASEWEGSTSSEWDSNSNVGITQLLDASARYGSSMEYAGPRPMRRTAVTCSQHFLIAAPARTLSRGNPKPSTLEGSAPLKGSHPSPALAPDRIDDEAFGKPKDITWRVGSAVPTSSADLAPQRRSLTVEDEVNLQRHFSAFDTLDEGRIQASLAPTMFDAMDSSTLFCIPAQKRRAVAALEALAADDDTLTLGNFLSVIDEVPTASGMDAGFLQRLRRALVQAQQNDRGQEDDSEGPFPALSTNDGGRRTISLDSQRTYSVDSEEAMEWRPPRAVTVGPPRTNSEVSVPKSIADSEDTINLEFEPPSPPPRLNTKQLGGAAGAGRLVQANTTAPLRLVHSPKERWHGITRLGRDLADSVDAFSAGIHAAGTTSNIAAASGSDQTAKEKADEFVAEEQDKDELEVAEKLGRNQTSEGVSHLLPISSLEVRAVEAEEGEPPDASVEPGEGSLHAATAAVNSSALEHKDEQIEQLQAELARLALEQQEQRHEMVLQRQELVRCVPVCGRAYL